MTKLFNMTALKKKKKNIVKGVKRKFSTKGDFKEKLTNGITLIWIKPSLLYREVLVFIFLFLFSLGLILIYKFEAEMNY